jgi:hypothetical protein
MGGTRRRCLLDARDPGPGIVESGVLKLFHDLPPNSSHDA